MDFQIIVWCVNNNVVIDRYWDNVFNMTVDVFVPVFEFRYFSCVFDFSMLKDWRKSFGL